MTGWRRTGALLVVAVVLVGCSVIESEQETERALEAAGYSGASVDVVMDGGDETVQVTYPPTGLDERAERVRAARAAEIVWDTLDVRVGEIVFYIEDTEYSAGELGYSRAGLEALFGPRPASAEEKSADDFREALVQAGVIALVVVLLVCALVLAGLVALVRRARRGRAGAEPAAAWVVIDEGVALPPVLAEGRETPAVPPPA